MVIGKQLMFKRLLVEIPGPDINGHISRLFVVKIVLFVLKD